MFWNGMLESITVKEYLWLWDVKWRACRKLKEDRRKQQQANVKRKQALKEELRQKSLAGMAKHAEQKSGQKKDTAANDDDDDDQIGSSF